MAGCKRCVLKGGGEREREKEEKRKGKRRKKWGSKSFFFFFFISLCACFFIFKWSFFKYIRKAVSRLSRSYPLLFVIKIFMVSQFGDL